MVPDVHIVSKERTTWKTVYIFGNFIQINWDETLAKSVS